jgi:hypothetical protein
MNKAQQYINDYLECGWIHYRPALTPMPIELRNELWEHCTNSKYWTKTSGGFSCKIHGGIIICFRGASGICHDY